MTWQLTHPVAVGDLDPNGPYVEVKIVRQAHDSVRKIIAVDLEYGNTIAGVWTPGLPVRSRPQAVVIQGTDYETLVENSGPQAEETTYEAVKRGLYSFLATSSFIGPGALT